MELEILDYLYDHRGYALYTDLLNAFPTSLVETEGLLLMLADKKFVKIEQPFGTSVTLMPRGCARRSELHQLQQKEQDLERKHDRQHRRDIRLSVVAIIIATVTLLFTVLAHFRLF